MKAPIIIGTRMLSRKLLRNGDRFILGTTGFTFRERIERRCRRCVPPFEPTGRHRLTCLKHAGLGAQPRLDRPIQHARNGCVEER